MNNLKNLKSSRELNIFICFGGREVTLKAEEITEKARIWTGTVHYWSNTQRNVAPDTS